MNVNKDLNYVFTLNRQCLRILGIWFDPLMPLSDFNRSIRFIIITCIICFYVFLPQMMNVILSWSNMIELIQYIGTANYSLMALYKLISTWYHGETLRKLMTSVVTDWMTSKNKWERNTMLNIAKRGRTLSIRCYIALTGTSVFFICLHVLKFYRNMHQPQRPLVFRIFTYPYNVQKSPNYEITFFFQMFGGLYSVLINCSVDSFVSILLLHTILDTICAQLMNLRTTLNNLVDELAEGSISSSRFKKGLAAITMRHEHLIRNAKTVDDCYSAVLLVYMVGATLQLCFKTFQVFTLIIIILNNLLDLEKDKYYFQIVTNHLTMSIIEVAFVSFYSALILTHLYIYCYSGERLLTESTSMAYGVYDCKWYNISSKDAQNLMFMVYRSTIPLKLTAGKFGTFSLEMFGTMLRTSMGYVSILLTMMN